MRALLLAATAVLLLVASPGAVAATAAGDPDEAITVDAIKFVEGAPGELVETTILLKNQTRIEADITPRVTDMEAGPGADTAFAYVPLGSARRGAGTWIDDAALDELRIPAGQERPVRVSIAIPDDAGAGGNYAAVIFTARNPNPSGQIDAVLELPVPVLVTVTGEIRRRLEASISPDRTFRWSGGKERWTVHLHNTGDVHEVFGGRVRVDAALAGSRSLDLRPGVLLPGERRTVHVDAQLRDAPDRVTARLTVMRDPGNDVTASSSAVTVVPWWLLAVLAAAVALIAWRVWARRRAWDAWHGAAADDADEPSAG